MPQLPQPATGASIIRRNVASAAMPLTLTPLSLHSFVAAVWSRINCYCLRHTKLIHRAELSNTSSEADKTVEFIHRISKPPLLASSCRAPVMIIVPRVVHKKWQCDLPLQNFCTENHWRINTSTLSHSKEWRLLNRLNSTQLNVRTSLTLAAGHGRRRFLFPHLHTQPASPRFNPRRDRKTYWNVNETLWKFYHSQLTYNRENEEASPHSQPQHRLLDVYFGT